jgi:hypothetical protein
VKSVDGYDSFISFQMITPVMAIFIQLKKDLKHWINLRYPKLKLKVNSINELK